MGRIRIRVVGCVRHEFDAANSERFKCVVILSQAPPKPHAARFTVEIRGKRVVGVRQMAPQDAEAVSTLITQLGYRRTPAQVGAWIARVESAKQIAFVATVAGEVVGWIEIELIHHLQSAPFVLIGGLVVKERVRGLGVGRTLCERAEQWGRELHVDAIRVTSRSTRADAHRFYHRDGYRLDKTSLVFEKRLEAGSFPVD